MKRIALLAAAAALGVGCVSSTEPVPPVAPSGACPQSAVDYVVVTYSSGALVDPATPTIPCVYQGIQGARFLSFAAGSYPLVVTGYQYVSGVGVPVYSKAVTVLVTTPGDIVLYWDFVRFSYAGAAIATYDPMPACGFANCVTVDVAGIPADLSIDANFLNAAGSATLGTYCAAPGVAVDTITYNLVDHAGTSVASGTMNCCTSSVRAGIDFLGSQAIDLDVYSLRAQGRVGGATGTVYFDTATRNNVPYYPNCTPQSLAHYAADTGTLAWNAFLYDIFGNATFCP